MAHAWEWVAWSNWRRVLGGVAGAEALNRVPEEGLACRLRHGRLRGGFVGVGGGASADLLEGVHHVHPFSPSRSSGPLRPEAELLQGRPPGEPGGGLGGGGVRDGGPGVAGGGRGHAAVAGLAAPGGAGAAVAGAGDGYGRRGGREARWGLWGEGEVDMGRRWRALAHGGAGAAGAGPLGVVVAPLGAGAGAGATEAPWRCGERERRGWVRHAGGERGRRRLRDQASSPGTSGRSGGVRGSWGALRGAAWYWGGGEVPRPPLIRHVGVRWRQQLVVRVE